MDLHEKEFRCREARFKLGDLLMDIGEVRGRPDLLKWRESLEQDGRCGCALKAVQVIGLVHVSDLSIQDVLR